MNLEFLTVTRYDKKQGAYGDYRCGHGYVVNLRISHVKSGHTKSCRHLKNEDKGYKVRQPTATRAMLRGKKQPNGTWKRHRFGKIFVTMRDRCNRPNHVSYKYYGAKGIKVEWANLKEFYDDMYESYLKHIAEFGERDTTIDRIENNGNYRKSNCRWATYKEQIQNRNMGGKNLLN